MKTVPFYLMLVMTWIFSFSFVWAGPCCGGGPNTSALITGDDRSMMNVHFMQSEVIVDSVDASGVWRKRDERNLTQTLLLDSAYVFADPWQVGLSIPLVRQRWGELDRVDFGDLQVVLGYEFLPEHEFHLYRPKGFAYFKAMAPTGTAPWEEADQHMISSGRGFWSLGAGAQLLKNWAKWDALVNFEVTQGLEQNVSSKGFKGKVRPGTTSTMGWGAGYLNKNWRWGGQIFWVYEEPMATKGNNGVWEEAHFTRYAEGQLNLTYLAKNDWSGMLSYRDQSLFGSPIQTSLERGFSLQFQKRWPR